MTPPAHDSRPYYLNRYAVFAPEPGSAPDFESRVFVACHGKFPDFDRTFEALIALGRDGTHFPDNHFLFMDREPPPTLI